MGQRLVSRVKRVCGVYCIASLYSLNKPCKSAIPDWNTAKLAVVEEKVIGGVKGVVEKDGGGGDGDEEEDDEEGSDDDGDEGRSGVVDFSVGSMI